MIKKLEETEFINNSYQGWKQEYTTGVIDIK